jgi:hypothetical protein
MNAMTCEQARQLAGQKELSGQVLAARWHVYHCAQCQRLLIELGSQIAVLDGQLALQKLLGTDLGEAICQQTERVITWLARGTRQVVAVVIRLSAPATPLVLAPHLATLGGADTFESQVIRQDVEQAPDGTLAWKVTFFVDSAKPGECRAEIEVSMFDRWDLAGVEVFLTWNGDQRHGQTDEQGRVQFTHIPVEALGQTNVIIHPPQLPINMNGPQ